MKTKFLKTLLLTLVSLFTLISCKVSANTEVKRKVVYEIQDNKIWDRQTNKVVYEIYDNKIWDRQTNKVVYEIYDNKIWDY